MTEVDLYESMQPVCFPSSNPSPLDMLTLLLAQLLALGAATMYYRWRAPRRRGLRGSSCQSPDPAHVFPPSVDPCVRTPTPDLHGQNTH